MRVKQFGQVGVSTDHLVERIDLLDVESHKGADQRRDASLIHDVLLRTHVVKCSQIDHISHFQVIDEGVYKPTG